MSAFADQKRLSFFFDYISHNAYLAWHKLPELARAHGLTLTPVPVLFGAMLSHHKQVGPAEVPAKSRWMLWNVLRKAKLHDIPIAPPASHPFNPLVPLRATCAVESGEQQLRSPSVCRSAQSLSVTATTSRPSSRSRSAATALSTPPLSATRTRSRSSGGFARRRS